MAPSFATNKCVCLKKEKWENLDFLVKITLFKLHECMMLKEPVFMR